MYIYIYIYMYIVVVMGAELALRRGERRGAPARAAKAAPGEKEEAVGGY